MSNYITVKESFETAKDNLAFAKEEGAAEALLANFIYNLTRTKDLYANGESKDDGDDYNAGILTVLSLWDDAVNTAFAGHNLLEMSPEAVEDGTQQDLADNVRSGLLTEEQAFDLGLKPETLQASAEQAEFLAALAEIFGSLTGDEEGDR